MSDAKGSDRTLGDPDTAKAKLRRDQIAEARAERAASKLRNELSKARFASAHYRQNILVRLRKAEKTVHNLNTAIHKDQTTLAASLYQAQQIKNMGGVTVTVEASLDGQAYSNPAPTIPHSAHVWIKATIVETIVKPKSSGVPITHTRAHVHWVIPSGWVAMDTIPKSGRDEFLVSNPLTIIREFTAPSSGPTNKPHFCYVDVYEQIDEPSFSPG